MNIAAIFIRRSRHDDVWSCSQSCVRIMAYRMLPVSDLPNVDLPDDQRNASLPGEP